MVGKKTILCEMAFWKKFSELYPASMPFPDQKILRSFVTWIEIYRFLTRSNVRLDCSVASFIEYIKNDERLFYIWKKSTEGECSLEFIDAFSDLEEILKSNPFSVLMTGTGKGPVAKKYGLISLHGGNCLTKGDLFVDNGRSLHKDEEWCWEDFGKIIPDKSSNAMLIVDNYILKNGGRDLLELLNQLLPNECELGYHLTIFYYEKGAIDKESLISNIAERKPGLVNQLQLELIQVAGKQDFHDRAIITNNYWISIGGGFDISVWDRETRTLRVKRSTNMEIVYPYFASMNIKRIDTSYENLLDDVKQALIWAKSLSRNRLLEEH